MSITNQLSAIMFVDIVGYTFMIDEDEQAALQLRDKFLQKLKIEVTLHHGKIYDLRGDGALCSFQSATEAINAALAFQLEMQAEPNVPVRIGIHQGEIKISDNEVQGSAVNIASRIESFATAGSILISGKVFDDIKNKKEIETVHLGRYKLKFVKEPIDLYTISHPGLEIPKKGKLRGKGLLYDPFRTRLKWIVISFTAFLTLGGIYWLTKKVDNQNSPFLRPTSIAVLYFENMSGDPEKEYFSDGMTEEIISHISRIEGLRVISRSSVLYFKGKALDLSRIARDLKVSSILEGSVRLEGNEFRIAAKMIDVKSEEYIWSETFDGKLENIFQVQQQIAEEIATALKVKITAAANEKLKRVPTRVIEAYDAFQRGKYFLYKRYLNSHRESDFVLSRQYFEKAIALDAGYAEAYAGLAELYDEVRNHSLVFDSSGKIHEHEFPDSLRRLKIQLARRAIQLNPESPYALTAMAWALYHQDETAIDSTMDFITHAYRADPEDPLLAYNLGIALIDFFGLHEIGIPFILQAIETDPLDPNLYCVLGDAYMNLGLQEEGRKAFQTALDLADGQINREYALLYWLIYFEEFDIVQKRLSEFSGHNDFIKAYYFASSHQPEKILQRFKKNPFILHALYPEVIQGVVMASLEKQLDQEKPNYNFLQYSTLFTTYHSNQRFKAILTKSKFIHDQYKKKYGHLHVIR